ncbi:DNA adenine methylase [Helicobacter cetorum]|uniref:Site-specific DNA-methyltransferase (adenine-specific) n=1 Tax=Helicobacter cetorum (strain ATCC BAA-540 / CCUG 52418 / MIT 99-5656) TaxID=1163745 RepID=I0ER41_HELCM|nr:DNA adenine methylase [Helicobacter cetorum]AFI05410.1 adenine-specific methyltransferase [Helicobacter cetorum MIT 99-5656]
MPSVIIPSCFNYIGGKTQLLPQILKHFPKNLEVFVDLFCGGCSVGLNAKAKQITFNDSNTKLIKLLESIKNIPYELFMQEVKQLIATYNFSKSDMYGYEFYQSNSSKGLANINKMAFLKLREDYNTLLKNKQDNVFMFYTLIVFAFNNQIRFNQQGLFNLPVGKRDFNANLQNKFIAFSKSLAQKNSIFSDKDFREFETSSLPKNTLIYCDPPYLITNAPYNESNAWTIQEERDLLNFLDNIDKKGLKFALSNVLASKNQENFLLKEWAKKYHCHYLKKSYANSNYQRKNKQAPSIEVLITNY